jgi:AcrR family transcriptional regulator
MKTKSAPKTETNLKSKVMDGYIDYVLTEGKNPTSVYLFAKNIGIEEGQFYQHYNSFDAIAVDIWESFLEDTITRIQSGEEYAGFSTRERILTFYYTLIEVLKKNRSYVAFSSKGWMKPGSGLPAKKAVERKLEPFFEQLIDNGFQSGELAERPKISDFYTNALKVQFWFILDFWLKDQSREFEDTDAAIEKAINLGFGLMSENTLDKAFDFVKFLWGRRN